MFVVGLTGGIGSGKSAVSEQFAQRGVTVVDADVVARQVVEKGTPALAKIAEHFGPAILLADGTLDRAALRERIFADECQRGWLEKLLHPLIFQEINRQLKTAAGPYALLVSPLLVETGQSRLTQRILVVDVPEQLQVERTMARDGNNAEQVKAIMAAQAGREQRLSYADDVIHNDSDLEQLKKQVDQLHQSYLKLASR